MGLIHIMERSSDNDVRRFEEGLKMAKEGIMEVCDLYEEMKSQFSERGYGERYGNRYGHREDWDMYERRGRDSMGRYR